MALRDEYEGFIPSEREQDVTPQIKPEQPPIEEGAAAPVEPPVEEVAAEPSAPSPTSCCFGY